MNFMQSNGVCLCSAMSLIVWEDLAHFVASFLSYWKRFFSCQAELYSTHATSGNVCKEDIAVKVVGLNDRVYVLQHKISVAPIVSTVPGTDSLP